MVMEAEPIFNSIDHKHNYVRKIFGERRFNMGVSVLYYQPERLMDVCELYRLEDLIDAIDEAVSVRRRNYFNAFLEILGEPISEGGWATYVKSGTFLR